METLRTAVYNSWLHPTTSALQQHTCTPSHGDVPHIRDGVRKLGLPSRSVSTRVLDQNILCIRFSCCEGVIDDTATSLGSAEDQPLLGTRLMEVDAVSAGSWLPREHTAITGLSEMITKAGHKE